MKRNIKDRLYVATVASDACEMAAGYGVGIELNQYCYGANMEGAEYPRFVKEIKEMQTITTNMTMHAPFNEIAPCAIDPKMRRCAMERLNQCYEECLRIGIKRMVVHSGQMPAIYFPVWYLSAGVDFWKEFMSDKPADFHIMIENMLESESDLLPEAVRRIDDPRVSLCFDVGHMLYQSNQSPEKWVEEWAPYTSHIHLHNNDKTWDRHYTLDRKDCVLDMEKFLPFLLEKMPEATITLEHMMSVRSFKWLEEQGYLDPIREDQAVKWKGYNSWGNLQFGDASHEDVI